MNRLTVKEFAVQAALESDSIPVKVQRDGKTIRTEKSFFKLATSGDMKVLESKISSFIIKRKEIIIQVR